MRSGGQQLTYLQLVESYRDGYKVRQRVVARLGREDRLDPADIDRLVKSLAAYGTLPVGDTLGLEAAVLHPGQEFGAVHALNHVWSELGVPGILTDLAAGRRFAIPVSEVVKAIVFARVLKPSSERAPVREWLARVYTPEFEELELQHA